MAVEQGNYSKSIVDVPPIGLFAEPRVRLAAATIARGGLDVMTTSPTADVVSRALLKARQPKIVFNSSRKTF